MKPDRGGHDAPRLGMWPGIMAYAILMAVAGYAIHCTFSP